MCVILDFDQGFEASQILFVEFQPIKVKKPFDFAAPLRVYYNPMLIKYGFILLFRAFQTINLLSGAAAAFKKLKAMGKY